MSPKKILLFASLLLINFLQASNSMSNYDPKLEAKTLEIVFNTLLKKHLVTKKIDDTFSKNVLASFLDNLDINKLFFLQSDIQEFKKFDIKLDDQIKNNDLTAFYFIRQRYLQRMEESKVIYTNLIKNKLNYNINDSSKQDEFGRPKLYTKTKGELTKRWSDALKSIVFEDVKLNYETNSKENIENIQNLIADYETNKLSNRMEYVSVNVNNVSKEMVFEKFLNAIVVQFDFHSEYYLPYQRYEYLKAQSGKSEGIGIQTALKENFIQIKNISEGGPVWKTKKIALEDIILSIAQEGEEPVSVVGYSLMETAKLTRGKAGTIVKLTIKKPDGTIIVVPIKREVISWDDSYIKSCLVTKNKAKYAIISFPKFYLDFDDDQVRNVVNDFEEELLVLKQSGAQGLVIDIRGNGGGSVEAAVKIIGNFISKKPVAQLKNKDQQLMVLNNENETKNWDKSLVLIVDSETASAAEIFASAFKEFNIGVIIGEPTFGKGTVQEFIDLNVYNSKKNDDSDMGALRMTIQKFYNLNGKSVQKTGVFPDINFSTLNTLDREKSKPNTLDPDSVKAINFTSINKPDFFKNIIINSQIRLSKKPEYNYLINDKSVDELKKIKTQYPKVFKSEMEDYLKKNSASPLANYNNNLVFEPTVADIKMLRKKGYLSQKRKNWYQALTHDFIVDEAINILEDINSLK